MRGGFGYFCGRSNIYYTCTKLYYFTLTVCRFKHPEPYVFPYDPEGVAHGREVRLPEEFIKNGDGRGKLETLL